ALPAPDTHNQAAKPFKKTSLTSPTTTTTTAPLTGMTPIESKPKKRSEEMLSKMARASSQPLRKSSTTGSMGLSAQKADKSDNSGHALSSDLNISSSNWMLNNDPERRQSKPILESLDQNAPEVQSSIYITFANHRLFNRPMRSIRGFSVIRATYKMQRLKNRQDPLSTSSHLVRLFKLLVDVRFYYSLLLDFLKSTSRIVVFMILDLASDVIFCLLYLFEIQWNVVHYEDDSVKDKQPRWLWISRPEINFVICLKTVLRLRGASNILKIDVVTEKLIVVAFTILSILYTGMCLFNYFEVNFRASGSTRLNLVDSIYFVVVSLSTVGYGDITPITPPGKFLVIFMILVSLVIVPSMIASLADAFSLQKSGSGMYVKGSSPFVVIVGVFDTLSKMVDVLESFLE
ncbi:potassium channel, sub T, member 1, partial [Chytridiales sp. JEL 0842]